MSDVSVSFHHGLGDSANFARLIPLYTKRGHTIGVECTPDKEVLFRAAGAKIVEKADRVHPWSYPPTDVHTGHGRDWQGSKSAWNISESPLPKIGDKAQLWPEYCNSRVRVLPHIPQADVDFVRKWLEPLPRPVVLLHSKGNTGQERKSLPDEITSRFYRSFLDRCDGALVLLDWDRRVPPALSWRARQVADMAGGCTTERLFALMEEADLMIGVDSGPLHACGLTDTPSMGVWMPGHYPARYTLPRRNQLNVVLAEHTRQWNRYRRIPWNIVEHAGSEYDADELAGFCCRMLNGPRYLSSGDMAADVQLQQWILDWCRGRDGVSKELAPDCDRHRSFDGLFREISKRFEAPTIVETGTIRGEEDWSGAGFFTYLAAAYLHRAGGRLFSVDLNETNCRFARQWCQPFGPIVQTHCRDSVAFLGQFTQPIDVLYLDSLDTYEPGHAEHALAEIKAALPRLHNKSLVIFDDTPSGDGAFVGKGAQAVPWMLKRGWRILYGGYQALLSRVER